MFTFFLKSFPHGAKVATVPTAIRFMSPETRFKGHTSQLSQFPLKFLPENIIPDFPSTCHGPHHWKGMGNVLFFFLNKLANCHQPKIGVLLVRRKEKIDCEYLLAVSATSLHDPFSFFPVMQKKMANEPHFCFLLIVLIKCPFHSKSEAACFRVSRKRKKKKSRKFLVSEYFINHSRRKKRKGLF